MKATLILENGTVFVGESIGSTEDVVCELVFNTSMVGYQEILTDPAYAGQGVVMTYPLIGNYGTNDEDDESENTWVQALVIRHLAPRGSNFRCTSTLNDYLIRHGITGIQDIDTRALTRILRTQGVMNAVITCNDNYDIQDLMAKMRAYKIQGAVEKVTVKETVHKEGAGYKVAMLDLGERYSVADRLVAHGCDLTIYPANTPANVILAEGYEGIVLSNGPGDPADCSAIIPEIRKIYESGVPTFGIALGHQLMALATGAKTEKLLYGHRGANHPVRDLARNCCMITSQNHGYAVVKDSVDPAVAEVAYVHVNDGSVEGLRYKQQPVYTIQFQPEMHPVNLKADHQLVEFIQMIEEKKGGSCNA
ncbi:MAG: carbamoyl phosphate synthase small subunit [Oscillospiraceae bacterium]|nr:carbamoyl phosphate synthase small subunit [Oscillospiraceae bacterium]